MKKRRKTDRRRHGMQVVTLCISTTMVLVLLGLVALSVLTARNVSTFMRENVQINVILNDTVTDADGQALGKHIATRPFAKKVDYVSKEQALSIVTKQMGTDPMEFTGVNFLEAELDVQVNASYANVDSLKKVADVLKKDSLVLDVVYPRDQIVGMNRILQPVTIALLVLAGLLIFICYTLVNNSVQLSVYAQRFTIHTMKLVGARWGFIRRPFLKRAMTVGLVSAVLACLLLAAFIYALYRFEPTVFEVLTREVLVITGIVVFVFGIVFSLLCTLLSVNRFLRMTAGELYKN
ncbi:MAG: permease-like cell division protein FtsX [Prevotella sp.]|nr:permease-like cell division protein FtsX [Prevotella sp.]